MKSIVYARFEKAGLGNKLLTWSRAYVFAQLNSLELQTSSWFSFFAGAWLRREKKKRLYIGYFKKQNFFSSIKFHIFHWLLRAEVEPEIDQYAKLPSNTLFLFNKTYREFDFFKEVRPYKLLVKQGLFDMLTPPVKQAYEKTEKPVVGMHIRRGDFTFSNIITPIQFFIEALQEIRKQTGQELPATIFTDASEEELLPLLKLPNVKYATYNTDIVDLLLLSTSEYLLTSVSSTFSYWAAFLSEAFIIKPAEEWHVPLRADTDPLYAKEIIWPRLSLSNLQKIS